MSALFLRHVWNGFRAQPAALVSLGLLGGMVLLVLAAPLFRIFLGLEAETVDLFNRFAPPSPQHWLGTDEAGRDLFLRLLEGGRVSLFVGLGAALMAACIGTCVGLLAALSGARGDAFLMRMTDAVIALPLLPLLIVLAALDLTKLGIDAQTAHSQAMNIARIMLIVALVGWTGTARLVRAAARAVLAQDYLRAAVAMGAGRTRLVMKHILPNIAGVITVATTLAAGHVILLESVLSFLGFGIQPPMPSWGNMLANAQELISTAPAQAVWPGLMIFLTVMACNFVGDGLQRALDPRGDASGDEKLRALA